MQKELDDLNDGLDDLNDQLDSTTEHYEKIIEETEEYYKKLTDPLEEYMKKWEDLMEIEEKAQNRATLESLGYSVEDILNMDEDTFESFKTNYLGVLGSYYENDELMLAALNDVAGQAIGDYLEAMQPFIDSLNTLDLSSINAGINTSYDDLLSFHDGVTASTAVLDTLATTVATDLEIIKNAEEGSGSGSGGGKSGSIPDTSNIDDTSEDDKTPVTEFYSDLLKNVKISNGYNPYEILTESMKESVTAQGEQLGYLKNMINTTLSQITSNWDTNTELQKQAILQNMQEAVTAYGVTIQDMLDLANTLPDNDPAKEMLYNLAQEVAVSNGTFEDSLNNYQELLAEKEDLMTEYSLSSAELVEGQCESTDELVQQKVDEWNQKIDDALTRMAEAQAALNGIEITSDRQLNAIKATVAAHSHADGNAHFGNAYAGGTIGADSTETALVGELGQEIVVNPESGQWRTVGDNGAEFEKIKRGEIVFNHKQSESLIKNGHINSRGKAFANGNATYTPLSSIDPDKYALLTSFTNFANVQIPAIKDIENTIDAMARQMGVSQVTPNNINKAQNISINIGDIQLSGVQDVNGLSRAIVSQLPNMLLQEIHRN